MYGIQGTASAWPLAWQSHNMGQVASVYVMFAHAPGTSIALKIYRLYAYMQHFYMPN